MDFTKKYLNKCGWREGKGLGKNENGIIKPIKPTLKFDKAGFGMENKYEYTKNWCDQVLYSMTLNKLKVLTTDDCVHFEMNGNEPGPAVEKVNQSCSKYQNFINASTLKDGKLVNTSNQGCKPSSEDVTIKIPTDEELFAACGGRTAHKGARHGICLVGKLSRLEKQEKMLLKQFKKCSISDSDKKEDKRKNLEKKIRQINKTKEKNKPYLSSNNEPVLVFKEGSDALPTLAHSVKKRKDRKRVYFSETVTEYRFPSLSPCSNEDEVASFASKEDPVVKHVDIKDGNESSDSEHNDVVCVNNDNEDEGIDCSDFDPINSAEADIHEMSFPLESLSKKERKILKRKLKKQALGATAQFVEMCRNNVDDNKPFTESTEVLDKTFKRKIVTETYEFDKINTPKRCHLEYDPDYKRKAKKERRKKKKLQKKINEVTESLNKICTFFVDPKE